MYNSKMIDLLRYFSNKELNKLSDYFQSPFFNKDADLTTFFEYVKKFAPQYSSIKMSKAYILKNGINGISFDEKKLAYFMNYFINHAEHFIKYNNFFKEETEGNLNLLIHYNKWGADNFFESTLRKAKQELERAPFRNADFYLLQYRLETEITSYFDKQKKRSFDPSLQKATDYLDLFYISTKLKYLCELMNRQLLVAENYEIRLLNEIFNHVKEKKYDEYPPVTIYYQILIMFREYEDETHFHTLKKLLDVYATTFSPDEARDMYAYAQNYCITKSNAGNLEYLTELLDLYKTSIKHGFIISEGFISPWGYKNIVSVATRLGATVWAEEFILQYREYLNPKFKDNAYNYNYAYLLFSQKKFGEALRLLNSVEFTDVFYALDSRTLVIKIYYEMGEISSLISSLDAFRVYLRRNKIVSENMRTVYSNFVKFTDALLRSSNDKTKLQALKKKLQQTKFVADVNWLLGKMTYNFSVFHVLEDLCMLPASLAVI